MSSSRAQAARGGQEAVLINAIDFFNAVSSGCTPLAPHNQPRPIPAANSHFHFPDPTTSPAPTAQKSRFEALRALRVCTGLGEADVGPCSTHPGASTCSAVGGGGAQEDAYGGRKVADFASLRENLDLRRPVRIGCGQGRAISTSDRPLRTREQTSAAWRAVAGQRRLPTAVAKSQIFVLQKTVSGGVRIVHTCSVWTFDVFW